MFQNVSLRIKLCLERAAEARQRAAQSADPDKRALFLRLEQSWNTLARSEDFLDRLECFLTAKRQLQNKAPPIQGGEGEQQDSRFSKGPLICVIDDDKDAREGIGDLLGSVCYTIAAFATAEEFLLSASVHHAACVVSDVQMPGISGPDLQDLLIEDGHRVPTIFVTAFPDERIRHRVLAAGAVGFLKKPFEEKLLIDCLATALADSR